MFDGYLSNKLTYSLPSKSDDGYLSNNNFITITVFIPPLNIQKNRIVTQKNTKEKFIITFVSFGNKRNNSYVEVKSLKTNKIRKFNYINFQHLFEINDMLNSLKDKNEKYY